jgi:hypothetical protein
LSTAEQLFFSCAAVGKGWINPMLVTHLFVLLVSKRVDSGHLQQIATVDHSDIRGLVTTGLHCVAQLAFLYYQGSLAGNARLGLSPLANAGLAQTRVLRTGQKCPESTRLYVLLCG